MSGVRRNLRRVGDNLRLSGSSRSALLNSSNGRAPTMRVPLTKKVGVAVHLQLALRRDPGTAGAREQALVGHAGVEGVVVDAGLSGNAAAAEPSVSLRHPFVLGGEQARRSRRGIAFGSSLPMQRASIEHGSCDGFDRKLPEDEAHRAGVDVLRLELRKDGSVELRTMRAASSRRIR